MPVKSKEKQKDPKKGTKPIPEPKKGQKPDPNANQDNPDDVQGDQQAQQAEPGADPMAATSRNLIEELYINKSEETYFRSPMVPSTFRPPFNSDDLYLKTGDYSIYEEMLQDDQVVVCSNLKKDLILGSGFEFVADDASQQDIVDELYHSFNEECEFSITDACEEIITSYDFGFSLTEKIFEVTDDNKLKLKALKTRHPSSWLLYQDDKGNIEKFVQRTVEGDIEVNGKALIHLINNQRFQNPYGNSDLRAAYNAYFVKRQIIRYMGIFLEKASSPIPVGRYDKNAPQAAVDKLFATLQRFQTKTAITIPKDIEIDFLEAKNNGDVYKNAINLFNMFIGRALFIPDLLGLTGGETGGGSHALGKEQMDLFFLHINRRRESLEKIINHHIVKPIVYYNYGDVENYPKFRFKEIDQTAAGELAKTWLEAVKGKVYKPNDDEINYFRELVKFPAGEVQQADVPVSPFGAPAGPGNPNDPNSKQPNSNDPNKEMQPKDKGQLDAQNKDGPPQKKQFSYGKLPPGDYIKKVDYKLINTKLLDYDNSIQLETQPVIRKIFTDLFDQIEKKKIVQSQNLDKIESVKLKYLKELQLVFKRNFTQLYKDSQGIAREEIFKGSYASKPLPHDKFMEFVDQETFQYIGDWEYMIDKQTRVALVQAIKDGTPLSTALNDLESQLEDMSDISIERYSRTKNTEVMNNARLAYFEDTGVVSAYQFSAILDDRTSDVCAGLDGVIMEGSDVAVPPLHFNCRSLLIPITKYEEYEPDSKANNGQGIDKFIDENIGKGFSRFTSNEAVKSIDITDPSVTFKKEISDDGLTHVTFYSLNEYKNFYKVTEQFDHMGNLISLDRERINVEATV